LHNRPQRILLIAKRDYLATIRTKAFIIGLVVAPILFGGGFLGVVLMQSKPDIKERSIAIVDATGIVAPAVIQAAHRQVQPRYVFEILPPAANPKLQRLELSDRVRHERLYAFVEIGPSVLDAAPSALPAANEKDSPPGPVATYINRSGFDEAAGWLADSINQGIRRVRLARLGVDQSRLSGVLAAVKVDRFGLVSRDPKTGEIREASKKNEGAEFGIPFGIMLLLGMIVMVGASPPP
jgi:ABC-type Na+ efflux pump permease subunit